MSILILNFTIYVILTVSFLGEISDSSSRVKIHACRFCNKTFERPCHVIKHERVHTGEKPYSCKMCGKSYAEKSNLKKHALTHLKTRYSLNFH